MTRRRKKIRTNYKLALDLDLLKRLAPLLAGPGMMGLVGEGYQLRASSGIWRKLDGTLTARFVYRGPGHDRDSLVLSVRNIDARLLVKDHG
jgi:hypothetical protein